MSSAVSHNIDDYESLLVALQNVLGVVVPEDQRSSLLERIEPLLTSYKLDSLVTLADKLQGNSSDLRADVLDVISRRQSGWHLSAEIKNVLHDYVFAQLPNKAQIWIVGCGQGQLAYSVAMEAAEFEQNSGEIKDFQLIATDVSASDIQQAESGVYTMQQLSTLDDKYKKSYITVNSQEKNGRIKKKIRQRINFSQCDLNEDFQSLGKMDLILCPEVLTYFSNERKAGILYQFSSLLKLGGILLPGSHQAMPVDPGLERVEHPAGLFYRQKT